MSLKAAASLTALVASRLNTALIVVKKIVQRFVSNHTSIPKVEQPGLPACAAYRTQVCDFQSIKLAEQKRRESKSRGASLLPIN